MLRYLILVSILYLYSLGVKAQSPFQSPYNLSYKLDIPVITAGLGLNFAYFMLDRKTPSLNESQIFLLNRNDIPTFDRSASYNWSKPSALTSDVLMYTAIASPSFLMIDKDIRKDWLKIGTIWAETMALTTGITNLTKVLVKRTRPFVYNPDAPLEYKTRNDAQYSFFSGHTSVTASMCFMTAKIYSDYHPNSKALPYIWAGAAIVPAATAFFRWKAGKHYFTDVLIGYLSGAAIGILVPHLHKIIK